jgi:hypothetical protein
MRCVRPRSAILVVLLLPALMLRASTARAAEPTHAAVPGAAPAVRDLIYADDSKSTAGAVVIEILFPGLGSVYAEDQRGAVITWALIAAGAAAMIVGISQVHFYGPDGPEPPPMPEKTSPIALPLIIGGAAVAVYGRIYGLQNAASAADRYNTALRTSLGLAPFVTSDAGGVTFGGRF